MYKPTYTEHVTIDSCYLLLATGTSSVVAVGVVPEYLNEAVVEKRLTTSVRSAGLCMACK